MIEYRIFLVEIEINVNDLTRPYIDILFEPDIPFEWGKSPEKLTLDGLAFHKWEVISIFDIQDQGKIALCKRTN